MVNTLAVVVFLRGHILVNHPDMKDQETTVLEIFERPGFIAFHKNYHTYNVVTENPLAVLTSEITEETLSSLTVKQLRTLLDGIQALVGVKLSKPDISEEFIQRLLAYPHKEAAVQQFLADKDVQNQRKQERFILIQDLVGVGMI